MYSIILGQEKGYTMKKGLIIQGPLISQGRTGKAVNTAFKELTEKDVVNYNCVKNIAKIYKNYSHLFDEVICVTWIDQDKNLIDELLEICGKENVLLIKDTTAFIQEQNSLIAGNNKLRQFLSTLEGAEKLKDRGCEVTLKIRTDQYLDCEKIMNSYNESLALDDKKSSALFVPWKNASNSYSITEIPDMYFVGSTKSIIEYSSIMLKDQEISRHVHTDIFYKVLNRKYCKGKFGFYKYRFLNKCGNVYPLWRDVEIAWSLYFSPLDKEIIDTITWRGEKMELPLSYKNYWSANNNSPLPKLSYIGSLIKIMKISIKNLKR